MEDMEDEQLDRETALKRFQEAQVKEAEAKAAVKKAKEYYEKCRDERVAAWVQLQNTRFPVHIRPSLREEAANWGKR